MSNNSMSSTRISYENIAVNRFGYGARGDELQQAKAEPMTWVKAQLTDISFGTGLPNSDEIFQAHFAYLQQKKQSKVTKQKSNNMAILNTRTALIDMSVDTINQAIQADNSLSWRLLDFFSNHFSVSGNGRLMKGLAATLEREAIAPNLLGNFEDLLLAVEQHPAMIIYLNNERSFGPNSQIGKKRHKGLNENLAREILELHTLGVNSGYSQADVISLATAITGWSIVNQKKETGTGFKYREQGHEPGTKTLLGKRYADSGLKQGQQMLKDLANNPTTAKYLCYKLAHHFVSETPPSSLLAKMEKTWLKSHGNIKKVMFTLFESEEAWITSPQKFKTPREFLISMLRAVPVKKFNKKRFFQSLIILGQEPFNAGSPAGFSDHEKDWSGSSALMARIDLAALFSDNHKNVKADDIMTSALGDSVSSNTYQAVMRAESRQQALTLLLMSPEFQRR